MVHDPSSLFEVYRYSLQSTVLLIFKFDFPPSSRPEPLSHTLFQTGAASRQECLRKRKISLRPVDFVPSQTLKRVFWSCYTLSCGWCDGQQLLDDGPKAARRSPTPRHAMRPGRLHRGALPPTMGKKHQRRGLPRPLGARCRHLQAHHSLLKPAGSAFGPELVPQRVLWALQLTPQDAQATNGASLGHSLGHSLGNHSRMT